MSLSTILPNAALVALPPLYASPQTILRFEPRVKSYRLHNSPHSSSVTFSRKGMHVARAETVGVVVILDRGDDYITFQPARKACESARFVCGPKCIPCFLSLLHQREHGWYLGMAVEIARMEASVVELGKLVRIRGRITLYQGSIQLKVRNVLVENDPNMEILHSLDCIRLTKEVYDKRSSSNR
ncbi:CST complex subunit STN1-like [Zingiber officinale]|uniref:CST complex subunit STN1-like n=1 Tax=Zingiber officinale TaxID=94328 RepID=UPI001C4ABF3E|nr:CST complex subunit STN1-like [Zingiber officinale]